MAFRLMPVSRVALLPVRAVFSPDGFVSIAHSGGPPPRAAAGCSGKTHWPGTRSEKPPRQVSPLTTTVYTHPSDEELWQGIRGLRC
jgi:hypothetical protein